MASDRHPNHTSDVPMLMPVWLENAQIKFFNPLMKPFAKFLPGFATVHHTGRTSGTKYETTVNVSRKDNLLVIGLIHGKTNWVKNVLAAGEADIHLARGGDVHVTNARVIPVGTTDPSLPKNVLRMTKRMGVFVADIA